MKATIVVLPGDGIGPEVTSQGVRVLKRVAEKFSHHFDFKEHLMGGCAIDATGKALPDETLDACKRADAILLGAVGGPKWDNPRAPIRPEDGLLALRKGLELYANLRPVKPHPALSEISPLRPERLRGVDFIVVRELTGGLYFGQPKERRTTNGRVSAVDTMEYHDYEIRRIANLAFKLAETRSKRVTSVDKANVLESSRLWRETTTKVAQDFPEIKLDHLLVDTCSMQLVMSPSRFDVIVTENTFGDILTDEAAVIVGSMGLLPSASLGDGTRGVYEPIHGSAPDIAGQGIANPIGTILSIAMLLRYSLNLPNEADAIERAVNETLSAGSRTRDIALVGERALSTTQMADAVIERI